MLALQPLDVIKTRLQVQDGAGALPLYKGTVDAMRSIFREEGWRALYAGEQVCCLDFRFCSTAVPAHSAPALWLTASNLLPPTKTQ